MKTAFGLNIPQTLEDVCDPRRTALLVYDMQVGILSQIKNSKQITSKVLEVLTAAREAGVRVFFSRHLSLPKELIGVFQFRTAMALATKEFAGGNQSLVSARKSRLSNRAGTDAASTRRHFRQDHDVGFRGNMVRYRVARLRHQRVRRRRCCHRDRYRPNHPPRR